MSQIASPFTIRVICKQLGFEHIEPAKVIERTKAAVAQIRRMQDHEQMLEYARLYCELQQFFIKLISEREQSPTEDMISDIVHARLDDDENPKLDSGGILSLSRTLIVGRNDTTGTAITNLLLALATRRKSAPTSNGPSATNGR
ncbi:MAG: hypothetical protein P8J20_11265 [Novosphingobium sp.]|nr:hypothetical protein [Novosphingobium sp.]